MFVFLHIQIYEGTVARMRIVGRTIPLHAQASRLLLGSLNLSPVIFLLRPTHLKSAPRQWNILSHFPCANL